MLQFSEAVRGGDDATNLIWNLARLVLCRRAADFMNRVEEAARRIRFLTDDQIVRCFIVEFGSPLFANDMNSIVIELFEETLVLGEVELKAVLPALAINNLIATKRLLRAFAWKPPTQWTNSFLKIIPGFSISSGLYSKQSLETALPDWKLSVIENEDEI